MKPIILIADGDAGWRDLARRLFATVGYKVETATDGLDCIEKLRRTSPGVLVLDLLLHWGGADGVLDCLREEEVKPAVVLTGDVASASVTERALASPVVAYFRKPLQMPTLLDVVRTNLAARRAPCERGAWWAGVPEMN